MPIGFIATDVIAGLQPGYWLVLLSAPPIAENDVYLMFQRMENASREDIQPGMDQPYVEFCGQGWSWYGHMTSVELERGLVRVHMDDEAARRMQNDGILEVLFDLSGSQFVQLLEALQSIFKGAAYFRSSGG